MRPKLRNLITDVYKDVSYVLDDDSYSAAEYQDVVRKRFVKSWEGLVDGYKVARLPLRPLLRLTKSRTGHIHRVQLPVVFQPRARCPFETMGEVHDGVQVHRGRSIVGLQHFPASHPCSWAPSDLTAISEPSLRICRLRRHLETPEKNSCVCNNCPRYSTWIM
jgi:hypothetical protein